LVALPFLSQRFAVRASEMFELTDAEATQTYADHIARLIETLTRAAFTDDSVNLITTHLTVLGATQGGGEREAHTIFDYTVSAQVFPATTHYVALGHIHRAQQIAAGCPVWYSGAPFQLDFGEAVNEGHVLIVDAEAGVPARVEEVRLGAGRALRTLRGSLESLAPRATDADDAFLRIIVEEPARTGLADEVRALFPNAVDVTVAAPDADDEADEAFSLETMRSSPVDLFAEYLKGKKVTDPALLELFRTLLEEAVAPEASRD
jgi:exonuclease SbcD